MVKVELVNLSERLAQAQLFIRKSYCKIDPQLPALLEVLQDVGAGECWHKHGTFFEHLHNVYRNLKLWKVPDSVARCGLFHSAYSNSYVNLAIFEPDVSRQKVRDLIGKEAEELVHWFCIVPRQQLIFDKLLYKYSDEHLLKALQSFEDSVSKGTSGQGVPDILVPREGVTVKHIRTGEDLLVPRRLIAIFLSLTIVDFSDQWYGWQDNLFAHSDGNMHLLNNEAIALWPGDGKPGLWMSAISRMGLLLNWIIRDEEAYEAEETRQGRGEEVKKRLFAQIELRIPPILNSCTAIVSPADHVESLNLYWDAVCSKGKKQVQGSAKDSLIEASKYNPHVAEPHILLAQILLTEGKWDEARKEAGDGLNLLLDWGTQWDKRMSWEGWIAWARVLEQNAEAQEWPRDAWGIISLGLVK